MLVSIDFTHLLVVILLPLHLVHQEVSHPSLLLLANEFLLLLLKFKHGCVMHTNLVPNWHWPTWLEYRLRTETGETASVLGLFQCHFLAGHPFVLLLVDAIPPRKNFTG